jgi:predicted nucleic acid-binding protein
LSDLIRLQEAWLIGPVRQEVLSGFPDPRQFIELRATLRAFHDVEITTADHEFAAEPHNLCRRRGIQGSPADFLICAIALRHDASIFTTDRDFKRYAKFTGTRLHDLSMK